MKKLYIVDIKATISGTYNPFFGTKPKKATALDKWFDMKIIAEEKDLESEVLKIVQKQFDDYKESLRNNGFVKVFDFRTAYDIIFNCIDDKVPVSFDYNEAKISECIDYLTPAEYKELYNQDPIDVLIENKGE